MVVLTADRRLVKVPEGLSDMVPSWYVMASDGVMVPRCDLAAYEAKARPVRQ